MHLWVADAQYSQVWQSLLVSHEPGTGLHFLVLASQVCHLLHWSSPLQNPGFGVQRCVLIVHVSQELQSVSAPHLPGSAMHFSIDTLHDSHELHSISLVQRPAFILQICALVSHE
jgi:hypothetical protein